LAIFAIETLKKFLYTGSARGFGFGFEKTFGLFIELEALFGIATSNLRLFLYEVIGIISSESSLSSDKFSNRKLKSKGLDFPRTQSGYFIFLEITSRRRLKY
jgi:hypothetical protein